MAYVKKMSKYIDIDIYGKCGKYTSDDNNDCTKQLSVSYIFDLAFESYLCKEYTTEKLFYLFPENFNIKPEVQIQLTFYQVIHTYLLQTSILLNHQLYI